VTPQGVALLHNPSAGGDASFGEVRRALERAGYAIAAEIEKDADYGRIREQEEVDFVVVAGGDGTVRRAARALAGSKMPLAILPVGTANNIAKSLGIAGEIDAIVAGWEAGTRMPFDLGVAHGQWGSSRFLESVGSGLVPAGIAAAEEHPAHKTSDPDTELRRALENYAEALERLATRRWTGLLDDEPIDDEFLLVEILNIPSVGANLELAKDADPSDAFFDVVTAREAERRILKDYLLARRKGAEPTLVLPTRRARRAEITGFERMHVDDELRRIESAGKVTIEIEPGAITFVVPGRKSRVQGRGSRVKGVSKL
jgi:diacylglycerol kinase (ATP)